MLQIIPSTDPLHLLQNKIEVGNTNLLLAKLDKIAIHISMRKNLATLQVRLMFKDVHFQHNLASKFKPNFM